VYTHDIAYTGVVGQGNVLGGGFVATAPTGIGVEADAYNSDPSDTAIRARGKGLASGGWYTGFDDGEAPGVVSDERTIVATGRTRNAKGEANVTLPALFKAHLKHGAPVRVSLTPRGDPAGILCVSASDAAGFTVRLKTVPGWDGDQDIEFDWVAYGTLEEPKTSPADRAAWDAHLGKRASPRPSAPPVPPGPLGPSLTRKQRMSGEQE
jgi:hypothetical protein